MSAPIVPVDSLRITPGQASRIACMMVAASSGSHDGRWPLPGPCLRKCTWMTAAPASNAARASRAISSGVTGTGGCFGSVSTPVSAQVITALSFMVFLRAVACCAFFLFQVDQQWTGGDLIADLDQDLVDHAGALGADFVLHFHRFEPHDPLSS